MMRQFGYFTILLVCALSVACIQTRSQMQNQEEKKVIQEQVKSLQSNRVESQSRIQEVSNEVLQLNGRIEVVESKIASLDRGLQMHNRQGEGQITEVAARVKTLEEGLLALNQRMDSMVEELRTLRSGLDSSKKSEKGAGSSSKGPERGPFTAAEEDFGKSNWGEAILNYMKYRDQTPTGKRYGEATYKIGYAFQQLGKNTQARPFYQEVIDRFPGTPYAKKAQSQLQKIEK